MILDRGISVLVQYADFRTFAVLKCHGPSECDDCHGSGRRWCTGGDDVYARAAISPLLILEYMPFSE